MRPTALTLVLYVFLVALTLAWSTRFAATYHNDGRVESWIAVGSFARITDLEDGAARTRSIHVAWTLLGLFVLAAYAVARGAAYGLEHLLRGSVPLARWLLVGSALTLALAFVVAVGWSRYYWGYAFSRPSTAGAVKGIKSVGGVSVVACDLSSGTPRCELRADRSVMEAVAYCRSEPYECTTGRIAVGLQDAGLLPGSPAPVTAATVRHVEAVLSGATFLVPAEDGYDGDRKLGGMVASGRSIDGQAVVAIGLGGGQISNDHFPYYELHASAADGDVRVLRRTVFFHDVAGIEGFEWKEAFMVASLLGLTAWLTLGLAAGIVIGVKRRRTRWHVVAP